MTGISARRRCASTAGEPAPAAFELDRLGAGADQAGGVAHGVVGASRW